MGYMWFSLKLIHKQPKHAARKALQFCVLLTSLPPWRDHRRGVMPAVTIEKRTDACEVKSIWGEFLVKFLKIFHYSICQIILFLFTGSWRLAEQPVRRQRTQQVNKPVCFHIIHHTQGDNFWRQLSRFKVCHGQELSMKADVIVVPPLMWWIRARIHQDARIDDLLVAETHLCSGALQQLKLFYLPILYIDWASQRFSGHTDLLQLVPRCKQH